MWPQQLSEESLATSPKHCHRFMVRAESRPHSPQPHHDDTQQYGQHLCKVTKIDTAVTP